MATNLILLLCLLKASFRSFMLESTFRFAFFFFGTSTFGMLVQVSVVHVPLVQQSAFACCCRGLTLFSTLYPVLLIAAMIVSRSTFLGLNSIVVDLLAYEAFTDETPESFI